MCKLDHNEGWVPKNWCFQTVVLEETLESPLDNKEIKPVSPKGNQPWIFIGRTDAEAEAPIHLMQRADSLEKTLMLGKTEDKGRRRWQWIRGLDGIHHWLNGCEFEQALGDSEEQGNLSCCCLWGHKESDMTATEPQQIFCWVRVPPLLTHKINWCSIYQSITSTMRMI